MRIGEEGEQRIIEERVGENNGEQEKGENKGE